MPLHAQYFKPNMGFGITSEGMNTSINIFNYYNTSFFGTDTQNSESIAEITFYDFNGQKLFTHRELLKPYGSLHLDIKTKLIENNNQPDTYGTVLCRLIPEVLPKTLINMFVSTEFVMEIISGSNARSFVHNSWSPVYAPKRESIRSEQVFSDNHSKSKYLILLNNYYGPKIPFLSHGRTKVSIRNHAGETISKWSGNVKARGVYLFSFEEHFPQLEEFMDGKSGEIILDGYNIVRKPITLVVSPNNKDELSVNHF